MRLQWPVATWLHPQTERKYCEISGHESSRIKLHGSSFFQLHCRRKFSPIILVLERDPFRILSWFIVFSLLPAANYILLTGKTVQRPPSQELKHGFSLVSYTTQSLPAHQCRLVKDWIVQISSRFNPNDANLNMKCWLQSKNFECK